MNDAAIRKYVREFARSLVPEITRAVVKELARQTPKTEDPTLPYLRLHGTEVPDPLPPAGDLPPPSQFRFVSTGETSGELTWTPAPSARVVSYRITRNGSQIADTNAASLVMTDLVAGTDYAFTIVSVDAQSATSSTITTSYEPGDLRVINVIETIGSTTARIEWSTVGADGAGLLTFGTLRYGTTSGALNLASNRSNRGYNPHLKNVANLTPETTYYYEIFAEEEANLANTLTTPEASFVTAEATAATGWTVDAVRSLPAGDTWTVIDSSDTGYLGPGWAQSSKQQLAESRVTPNLSPDARPAYRHRVVVGDTVDPISFDTPFIPVDFPSVSKVLFRYHVWHDATHPFSGIEGKWMLFNCGRGMVGSNHGTSNTGAVGTGGGGANTMHPGRQNDTVNGIRLLAFHQDSGTLGTSSYYGSLIGSGNVIPPIGRWVPIDVVARKNSGWSLYVDGTLEEQSTGKTPVRDWNNCLAVWVRHRCMFGGTPSKLPPTRETIEYFGGFFFATAP